MTIVLGGALALATVVAVFLNSYKAESEMPGNGKNACLDSDIEAITKVVHEAMPGGWAPELSDFTCNRAPMGPLTSAWARIAPAETLPDTVQLQEMGGEMSWMLAGLPETYADLIEGYDPKAQRYARFRMKGSMRIVSLIVLQSGAGLIYMEDTGA